MNSAELRNEGLTEIHTLSSGCGLKADVFKAKYKGQWVVVKDYSGVPSYLKLLAKFLVRREVAALTLLQGEANIVNLLKSVNSLCFVMEYIEGEQPSKSNKGEGVYDSALKTLFSMHEAGLAHNDIRRRNLILHPQRGVVFLDLGASVTRSNHQSRNFIAKFFAGNWLIGKLQKADIYHLVKLKKYFSSEPLTPQELAILHSGRPFSRVTYLWKALFRGRPGLLKKVFLAPSDRQSLIEELKGNEDAVDQVVRSSICSS